MNQPFQIHYQNLLQEQYNRADQLTQQAQLWVDQADYGEVNRWYAAHALCQAAFELDVFDPHVQALYKQIYSESWNYHSAMALSDADYARWFETCKSLNDRLIASGYDRAYIEQYDLIDNARIPHRNEQLANDYLLKGVSRDESGCLAAYGHNVFYGVKGEREADRNRGKEYLLRSKDLGFENADLYLLNIAYYEAQSEEEAQIAIDQFQQLFDKQHKALYVLADFYLRKEQDAEALAYLQRGIQHRSAYCKYLLGVHTLNRRLAVYSLEEGLQALEEALDYGVIYAALALGNYYKYTTENEADLPKAIAYYQKARAYGSAEGIFELALIYIYHPELKDLDRGLALLSEAMDLDFARAFAEKAYLVLDHPDCETDVETGKIMLEKAMALGSDFGPYRLGYGYQIGEFAPESDYVKALEYYEIAAARNNLSAIELVGRYNRYGYAGEPNAEKAVEYYQRALQQFNSDYARVELALCCESGFGVEQNYQEAEKLYIQAIENQYYYAAVRLAYLCEGDYLGEPNLERAFELYQIAAREHLAEGEYNLGRFYQSGMGVAENQVEALKYFQRALDQDYIDANVDVALAWETGSGGVDCNPEKAFELMAVAAEAEIGYAMYKLGSYYTYGFGVERNLSLAKHWHEKAYENQSPLAALALGDYYLYGYEETTAYERALEYYQFAESHGYVSEGIGICYEYELGVAADLKTAVHYYKIAAERGYEDAVYRLGLCHYYGKGTEIDYPEAIYCFQQVLENPNNDALYYAGIMLVKAQGVEANLSLGITYLTAAAEADNALAQYELGNCYLQGLGVEENENSAVHWYERAAENGSEKAQKIVGTSSRRRRN